MVCKFVGCGPGGLTNVIARVCIVNHDGVVLYNKYVQPTEPVTNFRTSTSGILPSNLKPCE